MPAKITGTFLDEITWDIGSQNWNADDWKKDFDAMQFIGIDKVIIIRGGLRNQAVFPSKTVGNPAEDPDLAQLFLDLADSHGMRLFFGTYDSAKVWTSFSETAPNPEELVNEELDLSVRFIDEVRERYCGHPAFAGWYLCHEVSNSSPAAISLYRGVASYLKEVDPGLPVMISPYYPTPMLLGQDCIPPARFGESWKTLLSSIQGLVDIVAFQDGPCADSEFPDYLGEAQKAIESCGMTFWNNLESFDRTLSYHFPPRDIRILRKRLEMAEPFVSAHITFEFSHFMSPNSCFPGAANLYRRYCETVLGVKSPY